MLTNIPVTYILIAINVALSFYAFDKPDVKGKLMMNPYYIKRRNQYYRFITSGFIHQDHMHLIMNMISLYFFGTAVESVFSVIFGESGSLYFIALYLLAIVVSDLPTYFKHKDNIAYNSLGASGGVAAIIFAFIIFEPLNDILIYFIPVKGFILGAGYIIYSYYQGRNSSDNVNHDAHLYGALFGLVFCIVTYPASIPSFFYQINQWVSGFNLLG